MTAPCILAKTPSLPVVLKSKIAPVESAKEATTYPLKFAGELSPKPRLP